MKGEQMGENKFLGCIGAAVSLTVIFFVAAITNGWALATLWEWFIVSTFRVPRLSIVQAIGLSITIGFLTVRQQKIETDNSQGDFWERMLTAFFYSIFHPVAAVMIGWIVAQFM